MTLKLAAFAAAISLTLAVPAWAAEGGVQFYNSRGIAQPFFLSRGTFPAQPAGSSETKPRMDLDRASSTQTAATSTGQPKTSSFPIGPAGTPILFGRRGGWPIGYRP